MSKQEFIKYANSFQAVARLRLESITELMNMFGNPQDQLKFIHVAGTNGKGSVCAFLQNILTDAGYKTGKFISPNMLRVNERITIDGQEISDEDLNDLLCEVEEQAKKVCEKLGDMPTQFEIWTAAAFLWYSKNNCDYVVLETGLGGTRDATNVIKNPVITVITRIAADHMNFLGNTLCEIAEQKAGIIKDSIYGGCTVTLEQDENICEILLNTAKKHNNDFIVADKAKLHPFNGVHEVFDYKDIKDIEMSMLGIHQTENAALAIECALKLNIDKKNILSGILKARNIGRLEKISEKPLILFDGAHNKNGMHSLAAAVKRYFPGKDINFIIAFMKDKDILSAVKELKPICSESTRFYTVGVKDNPRSEEPEILAEILKKQGYNACSCGDMRTAIRCFEMPSRLNIICGSLYLYKDFFEVFH